MSAAGIPQARPGPPRRPVSAPREWRMHVGAHKTGTTHFQALLAVARPAVAEAGGTVMLRDELRPHAGVARRGASGWRAVRHRLQLRRHERGLCKTAGPARRVYGSEEDMLGLTQDLLAERFYPDLSALDLLRRAAGADALSLFVSIRSYDTLAVSAFFEILKAFPDARARWEAGVARMLAGGGGWPELMARIERRVPGAQLCFWRQEDYSADPGRIVAAFLGVDLPPLPEIDRPGRTRAPALSALAEVDALDPGLPVARRIARVREIYARHPAQNAPAMLSEADATSLAARYERDVALLRARYPEVGAP